MCPSIFTMHAFVSSDKTVKRGCGTSLNLWAHRLLTTKVTGDHVTIKPFFSKYLNYVVLFALKRFPSFKVLLPV